MIVTVTASKLEELKAYDFEDSKELQEEIQSVLNSAVWNGTLYEIEADAELIEFLFDLVEAIDYED